MKCKECSKTLEDTITLGEDKYFFCENKKCKLLKILQEDLEIGI